jgi:hypothetical protein
MQNGRARRPRTEFIFGSFFARFHLMSPRALSNKGIPMPQQSLSDFVSAMEAAGMLVRVGEEKRVDQLPQVMEDHPTTAVLVEKITGCDFSFLANAYSNQDQKTQGV